MLDERVPRRGLCTCLAVTKDRVSTGLSPLVRVRSAMRLGIGAGGLYRVFGCGPAANCEARRGPIELKNSRSLGDAHLSFGSGEVPGRRAEGGSVQLSGVTRKVLCPPCAPAGLDAEALGQESRWVPMTGLNPNSRNSRVFRPYCALHARPESLVAWSTSAFQHEVHEFCRRSRQLSASASVRPLVLAGATPSAKTVSFSAKFSGKASMLIENSKVTISSITGSGTNSLFGTSKVSGSGSAAAVGGVRPVRGQGHHLRRH